MRITILGATDGTGQHLVRQAPKAGNHVSAALRNSAGQQRADHRRLGAETTGIRSPTAITELMAEQEAVASALDPCDRGDASVCSDGARAIIAMRATDTRRPIVITAVDRDVRSGSPLARTDLARAPLTAPSGPDTIGLGY
ncbi:NAD(P)H-binding protein [Streptomyces anulatus]|uniref:NAD(P)H-binding protein n=1 Tax=Streptomyces anulatus TaxID=1892 RepID=UPI0036DEA934